MARGKHAGDMDRSFYRDLVMMAIGIILVGAAVFLLLYLFSGSPNTIALDTTTSTQLGTTSTQPGVTTSTTTSEPTSTTSEPTSTTITVRPASEVRVVVLNSVGVSGAAGRKTQQLADAGYQTQEADDYEPVQDPSRIWYREGFDAEANVLLEFLPGATVEPIPDPELQPGADVVLVLGAGYQE
ncbi:MAG: LytR C-terminal domain-containing protein [Acidimicrobiia bacterium]